MNSVKNWTSVKINLMDILFEASYDIDIMLASHNPSANGANTPTAITSLSIQSQENLELKMSEINLVEQALGLNES